MDEESKAPEEQLMEGQHQEEQTGENGKRKRKRKKKTWQRKEVRYRRFATEAALRIWQYRLFTSAILALPAAGLNELLALTADSTGTALTTADFTAFAGWRGITVFLLLTLLAILYIVTEIFGQICLCDDIVTGGRTGTFYEFGRGLRAGKRFVKPTGILLILLLMISAPLTGIGFVISPVENFYVPRFISSVIYKTPRYMVPYVLIIALLLFCTWQFAFSFHAVLIDCRTPREAMKDSVRIVREHWRTFLAGILKPVLFMAIVMVLAEMLFDAIPSAILETVGENLPAGYRPDLSLLALAGDLSDEQAVILVYRIACAFFVFLGNYFIFLAESLCRSNIMLQMTRMYYRFTDRSREVFYSCLSGKKYFMYVTEFFAVIAALAGLALYTGLEFDGIFLSNDPVKITAHRTGGYMASENSLEGIDASAALGVYGSETDIQRTKDGNYIINHDNSFKRLTGVDRKPGDMTLEEIRELRIRDTTGSGALLPVPTMEELLDRGKGKITLFLELKGVSADRKMADDIVAAVRARDMVDEVILISLKADAIAYVEDTYPEFETGLLIFSGLGDVSRLKCDMIIMEEEMTTLSRIAEIHDAGKKIGVWTVNTRDALHHFLDMEVDTIVTDEVVMAREVQAELSERTDLEVLEDGLEIVAN